MIIKRWPFSVQRLFTAGHEVRLEYQVNFDGAGYAGPRHGDACGAASLACAALACAAVATEARGAVAGGARAQ